MKERMKRYEELVGYVVFGGLTTVVNIVVFLVLERYSALPYLWANAIAIILSILFAFFTNKRYVFKSRTKQLQALWREFYLFVGFRLITAFIDMISMFILIDIINIPVEPAKLITQVIVVVLNYISSKWFVFKQKNGHH